MIKARSNRAVFAVFLCLVCGTACGVDKKTDDQSLETREGFEKKMADIGIPIFPGGNFKEVVRRKAGQFEIVFEVAGGDFQKNFNDFMALYRNHFAEKLGPQGWRDLSEGQMPGTLFYVNPEGFSVSVYMFNPEFATQFDVQEFGIIFTR